MRRNATLKLESFDPDVLAAARDVAQRAGMPLETWLESVMAGEPKPDGRRRKRSAPPDAAPPVAAAAPPSPAPARSEPPAVEPPRPGRHHAGPPAMPPEPPRSPAPPFPSQRDFPSVGPSDLLGPSIAEMMRRLDALDRSLAEERRASAEATSRTLESIEGRIAQALNNQAHNNQALDTTLIEQDEGLLSNAVAERLAEIERKLGELNTNLTAPRPMGRRGRPLAEEVRDAVEEVRLRQRQLEAGEGESGDVRLALLGAEAGLPSPAIAELQAETTRLRESLGGLATGHDVSALEQAMRTLISGVEQARKPSDLAAVAAPIELLRVQVERLADDVAESVHARVSQQVERLASKVDGALSSTPASFADQDALSGLFRELDEVQRQLAALAGPERIQSLAQGLQVISQQVAQLQNGVAGEGPRVAELKPLLEEIRQGVKAPEASRAILGKIDALADKVDRVTASPIGDLVTQLEQISESLRQNTASIDRGADLKPLLEEIRRDLKAPEASRAILGRIDSLADKMDRVNVQPFGELIGRLDSLGESLRQPQVQAGDVSLIQRMLNELAEKVDRVSASAGSGGLDAIEKEIVAISRRLESRSADPAIGKLERMMADLLNEVSEMGNQAPLEAIVDRATRRAVAETAATGGANGIDLLRADFAEMCTQQAAADQRMHSTMSNLNSALEKLVDRLGAPGPVGPVAQPAAAEDGRSIAERLMASSLPIPPMSESEPGQASQLKVRSRRSAAGEMEIAQQAPAPHIAATLGASASSTSVPSTSTLTDELLEPGSGRPSPRRVSPSEPGTGAATGGDIKSSFIAAARRAAQAAQADLDTPANSEPPSERVRGRKTIPSQSEPAANLIEGLRASMDKRRRHLLLGLAAVVLTLGALQAVDTGGETASSEPTLAATESAAPEAKPSSPAVLDQPVQALAAKAGRAEPETPEAVDAPDQTSADLSGSKTSALSSAPPEADKAAGAPAAASPPAVSIPKVASVGSLKTDLAGLPTGLSSLRQAAVEGDGAAIFELAVRHADGRGMPRDLALAAKLYEKIASAGYAPAQFKLGSLYEKGQGVIRDLARAKYWYGRAAEQGNIRAMHNLAVLHAENTSATSKPDFATAASWFRRAAEYGVRDSQYNLAVLYARGLGLTQDLTQSYAWFSAAAGQGDEEAAKKRDDVAAKLAPNDLATAKAISAAFKPRPAEPAANETPTVKASGPAPMSLLGAPPPGAGASGNFQPARRASDPGV